MKKSFFISFVKFQFAAIIATGIDFTFFYSLITFTSIWYVSATAIGALFGAISNFVICRYWVTSSSSNKLINQAFKYVIVSLGSLLLNSLIIFILTDYLLIPKEYSRIITAIIVAIGYNFVLQKYYVFKQ